MLAWTDPKSPLDARRLSALSAKPENAHGASNAYRNQRVARLQFRGMDGVNQSQ
jgi:hypothetical protein